MYYSFFWIIVFLQFILSIFSQSDILCDAPDNPIYGKVLLVGKGKVGSLAIYTCEKGYEMQGAKVLKCESLNKWTSLPPKCVAPCAVPDVLNGQIGKYENGNDFKVLPPETLLDNNEELILRCNENYEPFGKNIPEDYVVCNKGQWKKVPVCKPANCRTEPPKGPRHIIDAYESEHGSQAYYSCAANSEKKNPGIVTCLFGKWTGSPPVCEDKRCSLKDVRFPDRHKDFKRNPMLDTEKTKYLNGETIKGTCSNGYDMPPENKVLTCENGEWSGSLSLCTDINECDDKLCGPLQTCINLPGKYECHCPKGYTISGTNCEDIDECNENKELCPANSFCINTDGSHRCECTKGYKWSDSTEKVCIDKDECTEKKEPCTANSRCENTEGSYKCICLTGYKANDLTCDDVDECTDKKEPCTANSNCVNTVGSYRCICQTGYKANDMTCDDVNECTEKKDPCTANSRCENSVGSYKCICNTGYKANDKTCDDINECTEKKDPCTANSRCENTVGSYKCICNTGYKANDKTCDDVNECTEKKDPCTANSRCENTAGSYKCVCNTGYKANGKTCDEVKSEDVDECTTKDEPCGLNTYCQNTVGSYKCICNTGYTPNGRNCVDVDECQNNPCMSGARCENTPGAYKCICELSFTSQSGNSQSKSCGGVYVSNDGNTRVSLNYSVILKQITGRK